MSAVKIKNLRVYWDHGSVLEQISGRGGNVSTVTGGTVAACVPVNPKGPPSNALIPALKATTYFPVGSPASSLQQGQQGQQQSTQK